jgi:hypothetical protein
VCGRINHYICDGDSGEDGGEEQRGHGQRRRGGGGAGDGAGDSFPAIGIMGERRPLAPFLHGFMGALPHGHVIHGGG